MDPRAFLPIAGRFADSTLEAEWRTSVGRSYYALFHVLVGALSDHGVIFREIPDDHRMLSSYLTIPPNELAVIIARIQALP